MNIFKNTKVNIYKILLTSLILSFIGFSLFYLNQNKVLENDIKGFAQVEYMSSGVQRVSKLELEKSPDNSLITMLNTTADDIYNDETGSQYFTYSDDSMEVAKSVVDDWNYFKSIVYEYRENDDRDQLFLASENNYNNAIIAIKKINIYIDELTERVSLIENCLIIHVIIMGVLLVKILFDTIAELKRNKELSKDMFIDTATGLYNRSKCQEVMKSPATPDNVKDRAVVIFDLNDLKKTNDLHGHRAGDQLIACFAEQLKKATNIFPYETFVGRYGGDEFMVYFDFAEEKDITMYIEEVNYLMKEFNEKGTEPFKLSCAAGYSITNQDTKALTMRELFDIADGNMYENKLAMKEKIRQKLREQGIEPVIVEDDRL